MPGEAVAVAGLGGEARRRRLVVRLAAACALLLLAVVVVSAYLRLVNAGLGCEGWPACYGHPGEARFTANRGELTPMRTLHRLAATAALLVVIALVALTRGRPALRAAHKTSLALLSLMLALSLLGWFTGNSTVPAVVLANLFGGFAMLALAWRLHAIASGNGDLILPNARALLPWARAGVVLLGAEIFLGTLISATFAARACPTLPACGDTWWPAGAWGYVFDLFADFAGRPLPDRDAGGVALHMLHRLLALATTLVLGVAALRGIALRPALPILGLLFVEMILGAVAVSLGVPLPVVVLHNAVAALLLVASVAFLRGLRAHT
jgi:cytochrome c oxidase assembly protein subunit 15